MQDRSGELGEDDERQRLFAFQTLLDGSQYATEPTVDLQRLRRLCSRGIPDHPPHLRPLAYALLLETLPPEKREWRNTLTAQREKYYTLVRTFMGELENQPTTSKFAHDDLLSQLSKDVKPLKASFWRSRTSPKRSSPFRQVKSTQPCSASKSSSSKLPQDYDENNDSDSDSVSDEGVDHAGQEGIPRPARITNRRAIFKRIDLLAQVEHRGGFGRQTPTSAGGSTIVNGHTKHDDPRVSGTDTEEQEPEEIMSPKITLSVDPGPGSATVLPRLEAIRPPPLNTSSLLPTPSTSNTIAINSASNSSPDTHKPPSPITLLSPKPLPSGSGSPSPFSGAMYYADTHLECLIRMLYIFVRVNHQWKYQASFVDIASNLYLIHSGGRVSLDHAEERTFWAVSAFLSEIDQALCLTAESGLEPNGLSALDKLDARLRWANPPFADILHTRNIQPTLYAYRWFSHLFIRDLPLAIVPTLFDFVVAESPAVTGSQPKSDLIIDIAVSMVLSLKDHLLASPAQQQQQQQRSKTRGLWGFSESEDQVEDDNEIFLRNIELLRNYPLRSVGGIKALLESAARFRHARLQATKQGDDPDKTPRTNTYNRQKMTQSEAASEASRTVSASSGSTSTLTSSYSWSRATSFFSSFSGVATGSATENAKPTTTPASHTQNRPDPVPQAGPNAYAPSTPGRMYTANQTRSSSLASNGQAQTFSPSSTSNHPSSPLAKKDFADSRTGSASTTSAIAAYNRERSDSVASSVSSITERLASLTQSTPPAKSQIGNGASSPLPRPLLLSGSARRASSSSGFAQASAARIALQRRDSSPLPSPRGSPPLSTHSNGNGSGSGDVSAILSPPASIRSPPSGGGNVDGNGLYRIGSRNVSGNRQRSRYSLGENESPISKLSLGTPVTILAPAAVTDNRDADEGNRGIRRDLDYGASTPIAAANNVVDEDGEPTPTAAPVSNTPTQA
ncbi:hypothetical protein I316_03307 [Kwoniella heveanensis BCC8398]|uniref:Rab-GAP TBC domain-containing protein n=1 Tax=Kwoniella heveanensis BCC8398 TaxID=1296120 RepID=A0A1B9GV47_9TREE|nr:hypothetical protein I316_03307 [Kwoniella heveanensis BCC8398]